MYADTGWGGELATCRKFAPTARNYTASKLMSQVGLRVSEACRLDLADIKWDLGRFGKLHVRHGKGTRGSGPRERMVPLINGADRTLRWFVEDVWGQFDDDHTRPDAPLFPSERRCSDGSSGRVGDDALRGGLRAAATANLPGWGDKLTPHVLRHFCASELYLSGLDLIAIQEVFGHSWIATTMRYVNITATRIRKAVDQLAAFQFDGHGKHLWGQARALLESEHQRLAVGQIAVPFGTPSEAEVTRLRQLIRRVEDDLTTLSDEDRRQIEEAVRIVRRTRQTVLLGMPAIAPPTLDPQLETVRP